MNGTGEGRYFVVRYMLGELRDEAVNIGIIGLDETRASISSLFLDNLDAKARADIPFDQSSVALYREQLEKLIGGANTSFSAESVQRFEEALVEQSGNLIRVRGPYVVLTDSMEAELKQLYQEWVAPQSILRKRRELYVRDPLGGLRREAQSAITKRIGSALPREFKKQAFRRSLSIKGKKHTSVFDAALVIRRKQSTVEHLFHHVLMLPDAEESFNQAASLLWKWRDVQDRNGAARRLTAVLFSRDKAATEGVEEARSVLRKDHVSVASLDQLETVARKLDPQLRIEG